MYRHIFGDTDNESTAKEKVFLIFFIRSCLVLMSIDRAKMINLNLFLGVLIFNKNEILARRSQKCNTVFN